MGRAASHPKTSHHSLTNTFNTNVSIFLTIQLLFHFKRFNIHAHDTFHRCSLSIPCGVFYDLSLS